MREVKGQTVTGSSELWLAAPYPVLVMDAVGVVTARNSAASEAVPDVRPGSTPPIPWLLDAHTAGEHTCTGRVDGRLFAAEARPSDGGETVWWLFDDSARAAVAADLAVERERTAFLAEASNVLLSSLNIDRCMRATVELAARHLADAAVVIGPSSGRRLPVVSRGRDGGIRTSQVTADPAEVPGLAEALQGFPPVPSRWIDPASVPGWLTEGFGGPVGSVVITPLPGQGVPAGALVLLRRTDHRAFSDTEEVFARLFAARAGAALSAARLYAEQADITATLMNALLPPQLEHGDGVEFAGGYRAAARSELVGGDFYDVHRDVGGAGIPGAPGAEREALVVLGDVCGKGLGAAVLTGKIRNTLHALTSLSADHQHVLRLLNDTLLDATTTRFATLVLASVSRTGERVRLRLTSAGHPPPLLVRADGTVEEAATRGTLIGALPDITSTTTETHLAPGESCLLFTDGLTEARGGPFGDELFGDERLRAALAQCAGMPAEAVVERVQMLVSEWIGRGEHDDLALVAITAPRGGGAQA
ncbi:PP2C family protein-serine/threonine phosphatase [Actinokineospora guangxiensis]|uniref:PP2C family protein-serine/threonine phosphatase n=1 Tax=Actinokineospora guangxiensis TaxID=1490288 RepID=A0ABW0EKC8_9PSEU